MTGLFWIASYPKSGNTWTRCLIDSLTHGGEPPALDRLERSCPAVFDRHWLEAVTDVPTADLTAPELLALRQSAFRLLTDPVGVAPGWVAPGWQARCLKVHDGYDPARFPDAVTAGAVYLVRDPRAVAPSWADHSGVTIDRVIARMRRSATVAGGAGLPGRPAMPEQIGDWSDHVRSWTEAFKGRLLLVRYEDLLADPVPVVARIAGFLGLPDDLPLVEKAVAACTFSRLRRQERETGFAEKTAMQKRFFRQGRALGWRDELSAEQAARLVADHGAVMARYGYATADGPAAAGIR